MFPVPVRRVLALTQLGAASDHPAPCPMKVEEARTKLESDMEEYIQSMSQSLAEARRSERAQVTSNNQENGFKSRCNRFSLDRSRTNQD